MGNELTAMSGSGGRRLEVWSDARARRLENELPTPHTIPLDYGHNPVPPALLLDAEVRWVADDRKTTLSPRSAVTVSPNSSQSHAQSKTRQSPNAESRRCNMSMSDTTSWTALPAEALSSKQRQLQKRTQYSMYARQMRRRGRDRGQYTRLHHNSGVDFMDANEFFNRSDSTVGSEANLDNSSDMRSSGSSDEEDVAGEVHHHYCGMSPSETALLNISGYHLAGNEPSEHLMWGKPDEVGGAPALVSAPMAPAATSPTLLPLTKRGSTCGEEMAAAKAVSVVVSGVDCKRDPPLALTSSTNSSHKSKSSAANGKKVSVTPLPSARKSSWHKRLLRSGSRSSIRDGVSSGSVTQRSSSDAIDGVLSSHEEQRCKMGKKKTSKRSSHPEELLELKHPQSTRSSAAVSLTSPETAGATATVIGVEGPVSGMQVCTTPESLHADAKRRHIRGDLGGQCGSFMRAPSSQALQPHATCEYGGGKPGANSGTDPPRSSESPTQQRSGDSSRYLDGGSKAPHQSHQEHHHCGDDDGNKAPPETGSARLVNTRFHNRQVMYSSSIGGRLDMHGESSNNFFASTQRSGQYRMLYGMGNESETSAASMCEAVCMATSGGDGDAAHSFGSFFAGSRNLSLYSWSSSPGQAWTGDYTDCRWMELTAEVDCRVLDTRKADDGGVGMHEVSQGRPSRRLPQNGGGVDSVREAGAFSAASPPQRMAYTVQSPSPVTNNPDVHSGPASSQGTGHLLISGLPMPPNVGAAKAPANFRQIDAPTVRRESRSAGTPRDDHHHGHAHTTTGLNSRSGDSSMSPDVSVRELVKSSRVKPAVKAVLPQLLPQPPPLETVVMPTKTHSIRGSSSSGGGGGEPMSMSATKAVPGSAMTEKKGSGCAGRQQRHGNGSGSSGGALHATGSLLTSVQGSGSTLRLTRADSKDLILRPHRTASARRRRRGGRDEDAPEGSSSCQRRLQNRNLSSGTHTSSFSFSSDSFLYGKVRGYLAKGAAAVAANSNSIERRRHMSDCGSSEGTEARARHHAHMEADTVALGTSSPSASSRKSEAEGPCCSNSTQRHPEREARGWRHVSSKHGNENEMGSVVAGLDDLLGPDNRTPSGNLTTLCLRSVSSSLSLAPSSRNSSANGSRVSSGSVRALRKRAAKVLDLSTSSSVDSEASGRLQHRTASLAPQQQQHEATGAIATASAMHHRPVVKNSNSSAGAVAANGSVSSSVTGGTRSTTSGTGATADMLGTMPMVSGHEKSSRRSSMGTNVPCTPLKDSGGGAHVPRRQPCSPHHAGSKMDGDTDSAAAASSAASLLAGPSRDSSTKRRRPTTQSFSLWSVDMSLFKALQEAQEPPSERPRTPRREWDEAEGGESAHT
ncbi:hypothetical protein, unknown function [Leishmania tarentolae]|uniref:Uncharacterized protein n=1 Tax=Leishmania tarentolae TaxID=5689 RepID=A0A640K832_LEITA|nr:hypothetical protein, unknown function [Leishmania tarentolae]